MFFIIMILIFGTMCTILNYENDCVIRCRREGMKNGFDKGCCCSLSGLGIYCQ